MAKSKRKQVEIYTDGSWKKALGAGGCSALLVCWPYWKLITSSSHDTTISRMELEAAIMGLSELTEPCDVLIVADSMYVVNSINYWIKGWKVNDWISKTSKQPVANLEWMQKLDALMTKHKVKARWVKAHTRRTDNHSNANRIVDYFAQHAADNHQR